MAERIYTRRRVKNKHDRRAEMELYQLDYVLHEPCEDQGWLYMAEIPTCPDAAPGRRPPTRP